MSEYHFSEYYKSEYSSSLFSYDFGLVVRTTSISSRVISNSTVECSVYKVVGYTLDITSSTEFSVKAGSLDYYNLLQYEISPDNQLFYLIQQTPQTYESILTADTTYISIVDDESVSSSSISNQQNTYKLEVVASNAKQTSDREYISTVYHGKEY